MKDRNLREHAQDGWVQGSVEKAHKVDGGLGIEGQASPQPQGVGEDAAFHPLQVEGVAQSQQEDAGKDDGVW